ncbi:blastula protease 10-like [Lethenteron reissneri]|uniref:blastula protease 10-like n=1 Tax=Lethenteron reissneri TaxID=7753 RepID=UPI002AB5F7AD|nr:blastula protease 10-like [Lethenteron reissneri]
MQRASCKVTWNEDMARSSVSIVILVALGASLCWRCRTSPLAPRSEVKAGPAVERKRAVKMVPPGPADHNSGVKSWAKGQLVREGDMMMTLEQEARISRLLAPWGPGGASRKAASDLALRWPLAVVPYSLDPMLSVAALNGIRAAMASWEDNTCIRFVPREVAALRGVTHSNYVALKPLSGCWSFVGMIGVGEQVVSIGRGCEGVGTVAHELGHAVGYVHEQSRPDRDAFISVQEGNVQDGQLGQFAVYSATDPRGVPYDLKSVMHYSRNAFSKDGVSETIRVKDPEKGGWIGQREGLSFLDVKLANIIYNCHGDCSLPCLYGGIPAPGCDRCLCPHGLTGDLCQDVFTQPGLVCGGLLNATQGYISSPGYPAAYPNNAHCVWLVQAPPGGTVTLYVEDASLESVSYCSFDYVEIRTQGADTAGARLCPGSVQALSRSRFVTEGDHAVVRLVTDASVTARGFRIAYSVNSTQGVWAEWRPWSPCSVSCGGGGTQQRTRSCLTEPGTCTGADSDSRPCGSDACPVCGGLLEGTSGTFTSPGYPQRYPDGALCQWTVRVPVGLAARVAFSDLDVEPGPACPYDAVRLWADGASSVPLASVCGTAPPLPGAIVAPGDRQLFVTFSSDSSVTGRGFNASFSTAALQCGGFLNGSSGTLQSPGYPSPYPTNQVCAWYIEVAEGRRVGLSISALDVEASVGCVYDRVSLWEGWDADAASLPLATFCGRALPPPVVTATSHRLLLVLVSDGSVTGAGFRADYKQL